MSGVTKRYSQHTALDGVSFELAENRIHGLLGRNGAGKTTIMQILTGQGFETSGQVEVFGAHPYENEAVLARICFVKEAQRYPDWFKVRHALTAARLLYPNWDARFAEQLVEEFALPLGRAIKKLSRGQLSAVGVIIGLASRAPLTLFDATARARPRAGVRAGLAAATRRADHPAPRRRPRAGRHRCREPGHQPQ